MSVDLDVGSSLCTPAMYKVIYTISATAKYGNYNCLVIY